MEHGANRRKQQRRKLAAITIIVLFLLAAAIAGLSTGALDRAGIFRRRAASEEVAADRDLSAGGQSAVASGVLPEGMVVYGGERYIYNGHLSNYLFLGVDTSGSIRESRTPGSAGQSDAIFLVRYDRAAKEAVGIAIPRDTIAQIEQYSPAGEPVGFAMDHLNLQYAYGDGRRTSCELSAAAVSRLLNGIPIDGYAAVNLESLPRLAELLGGVEVTVPGDELAGQDPAFRRGANVLLDASNTAFFLRSRDTGIEQSAMGRMERQKAFLEAFAAKARQEQERDASTVARLFEAMQPEMVTDMSNDIFANLALARHVGGVRTIPGQAGHEGAYDVYRVDDSALYAMVLELFYEIAK